MADAPVTPEPPADPPADLPLPFTFRGVAALAQADLWKLLTTQLLTIIVLASCCSWVMHRHWAPALDAAMAALPEQATLRDGRLQWPDEPVRDLASTPALRIVANPRDERGPGQTADLQIELRPRQWDLASVFGYFSLPYPPGDIRLDRTHRVPWWGARKPFLLLAAGAGLTLAFLFGWTVLAFLGAWVVRTVAFFADRAAGLRAQWQLAAAALVPSAMLLAMGVLCYGLRLLPLLGLMLLVPVAWIISWVYLFFAPFRLPRVEGTDAGDNPFMSDASAEDNPFRDRS